MKIIITENNKKHTIPLPIALLKLLPIFDKEKLPKPTLKAILRSLKTYKKDFGSFVLVDIEQSNNERIKIIV